MTIAAVGCLLVAVAVAAGQLVPREPVAGVMTAAVLALAPPVQDAPINELVIALAVVLALIAVSRFRRDARWISLACGGTAIALVAAVSIAGALPPIAPDLVALIASSGRGAAAMTASVGLLGTAFGGLTGLPRVGVIAVAALDAGALGWIVPLLSVLAIGAAIAPAAIVRVVGPTASGARRQMIAVVAGLPLLVAAALI